MVNPGRIADGSATRWASAFLWPVRITLLQQSPDVLFSTRPILYPASLLCSAPEKQAHKTLKVVKAEEEILLLLSRIIQGSRFSLVFSFSFLASCFYFVELVKYCVCQCFNKELLTYVLTYLKASCPGT